MITPDIEPTGLKVAQLYITANGDKKALKTLKDFKRVKLQPGQKKIIYFKIDSTKLSRWIEGKGFKVLPDKYYLMVGTSSSDRDLKTIELTVK